jgi:hypothetical protein
LAVLSACQIPLRLGCAAGCASTDIVKRTAALAVMRGNHRSIKTNSLNDLRE